MGVVSLTGNDTITVGGRIFRDFADGDIGSLDVPNNIVEAKTGKNRNTIYAYNATGKTCTLSLRLLIGSADDKYLNSQLALYEQDPPSYPLLSSEIIKRSGDGQGNISNAIHQLSGGLIQKYPNVKENVEGDTEQAVVVWTLIFANQERAIS